jgi:hypothetical protein
MAKYHLYEMYINDKRMKRGEHAFITDLLDKIQQNYPQEIAALSPNLLHQRLMELATELLNKNINPKANYWHLRTEEEDLTHAEEIVTEIVSDYDSYDAYIDQIRTLSQQDQEGKPGSGILQQDLFYQLEGPAQIRPGDQDVRIFGATEALPVNTSRVGKAPKVTTKSRKRKLNG